MTKIGYFSLTLDGYFNPTLIIVMNPLFRIDLSISDSLKTVRKSVLIYETIILDREIKRRTKAIGAFPDGQSALMLVCARLRHVAATNWEARRYMNMDHLFKAEDDLLSEIIVG